MKFTLNPSDVEHSCGICKHRKYCKQTKESLIAHHKKYHYDEIKINIPANCPVLFEKHGLKIGKLVRIKPFTTVWKGIWEITKFHDNGYMQVVRFKKDENGKQVFNKNGARRKQCSRIIKRDNIVEILFNPSKREN